MSLTIREEKILEAAIAGEQSPIEPVTRREAIFTKATGANIDLPPARNKEEDILSKLAVGYSGGGGGGEDVSLTKIGTVTITSSSVSCYLIGGLWKDSQGNLDYRFGYNTSSSTKSLDLYAPAGTSEVMIFSIQQSGAYMGVMNWTISGSVTKSTYYMTISGDCSISFRD